MRNDLVSIIVSIYNVEKYLIRCIDTCINQTYNNIEIILVNDGSIDGSERICETYAKKDKRIIYVKKENGGLGSARNLGMRKARGQFYAFINGDDYIANDYIEKLYNLCINNKCQISQCAYQEVKPSCKIHNVDNINKSIYSGSDIVKIICGKDQNIAKKYKYVWNKLFAKEIFTLHMGMIFDENHVNVDEFTTYKLFSVVDKVIETNEVLYFKRKNEVIKLNKKFNIKNDLYYMYAAEECANYFKDKNNIELYSQALARYCITILEAIKDVKENVTENVELILKLENLYRRNVNILLKEGKLDLKTKASLKSASISPMLGIKLFVK